MKRIFKTVLAAALFTAIASAFFGVRECAFAAEFQWVPALISLNAVALGVLIALALFRARAYCEFVCPLGIVQDLVRFAMRKKVRRVCSRLPESKIQRAVRLTVLTAFVVAGVCGMSFMWLDPYGIFGRGVTLTGGLFFVALLLAAIGDGRVWCNWICPVGTVLQAVSKVSISKDKMSKCDHCEECKKCMK